MLLVTTTQAPIDQVKECERVTIRQQEQDELLALGDVWREKLERLAEELWVFKRETFTDIVINDVAGDYDTGAH